MAVRATPAYAPAGSQCEALLLKMQAELADLNLYDILESCYYPPDQPTELPAGKPYKPTTSWQAKVGSAVPPFSPLLPHRCTCLLCHPHPMQSQSRSPPTPICHSHANIKQRPNAWV